MSAFSGVDETRTCRNCNNNFVFTVGEQEWMSNHGYDRAPNKCKDCRKQARESRTGGQADSNGGGTASNYNSQRPVQPSSYVRPDPVTEQKVTPTDYRKINDDEWGESRRRRDGGKRRRNRDDFDDNGDW